MADVKKNLTRVVVDADKDLVKAFGELAKANDRNKSILIRDFMRAYVKKNGQMELKL